MNIKVKLFVKGVYFEGTWWERISGMGAERYRRYMEAVAPRMAAATFYSGDQSGAISFEREVVESANYLFDEEARRPFFNARDFIPTAQHEADSGYDLRTTVEFIIMPGEQLTVGCGIGVEIPEGFGGFVLSRSGLAMKHGIRIVNAPGLIDPGYTGEIMAILHNGGKEPMKFSVGDRVAQLVIQRTEAVRFTLSKELEATERGGLGLGSTGVA